MEAFVSYPILNVFVCKCNDRDAHTIQLASVGLAPIIMKPYSVNRQGVTNQFTSVIDILMTTT